MGWFADEICRAEFNAFGFQLRALMTGDEDNGHLTQRRIGLERLANLEATEFRLVHIQQYQIRCAVTRQFERRATRVCESERREIAQDAVQNANYREVVIDQKNAELLLGFHRCPELRGKAYRCMFCTGTERRA